MKFKIKTRVEEHYQKVFNGFDEKLFLALKPPFLPLQLLRFDGCGVNDEVHIKLGKGRLSQEWNALIIEQKISEKEIYFIDKGIKLPFFLKYWQHCHRMINEENKATIIVDDITYQTPFILFDYLLFPILYLQFWIRKPVYRKIFNKKAKFYS